MFGGIANPTSLAVWEYVAAAAALVVLVRPRSLPALAVMSVGILVSAWLAAPIIGNHWVVASLLSLGLLGSIAYTVIRRRRPAVDGLASGFMPVARGVFLVFYFFSAIAKVNRGFVDPLTSCATFFADQTAHSLGWGSLDTAGSGALGRTITVAVIAVELSVVALLSLRRTRMWGILLAVLFHGLIGLNGTHSFADFTALVYALLVLFVPDCFFTWVRSVRARHTHLAAVGRISACYVVPVIVTVLLLVIGIDNGGGTYSWVGDIRDNVWRIMTVLVAIAVISFIVAERRQIAPGPLMVLPATRWLLIVPVIAIVNGVLPYAGLKTAYSWNMYSNLVTAPGYENGLLIPTGWGWSARQADLVQVLDSSDAGLLGYRDADYLIPMVMLRTYTSSRPSISLVYRRGDGVFQVDEVGRDPELSQPVSSWARKLAALRSVDATQPARCQDQFLPAL